MGNGKKLLYEVSIIRPIVILLLVLMHSFTKISSGGGYSQGYQLLPVYQWFLWLIKGFRIETIALVAGYVFAYQSLVLGRKYDFWPFVWKKFVRLIVPMIVFGLVYYFCFFFNKESFNVIDLLLKVLSGCGHLWFLPMLFWCFVAIWVIDRLRISSWWLMVGLAALSLLPSMDLPFGFGKLPHFLFFVYAGYFLWERRETVLARRDSVWTIVALWGIYVLLTVLNRTVLPSVEIATTIAERIVLTGARNGVGLVISVCGVLALYLTVCHFTEKPGFRPKQWVINASGDCYGVYVFHQFILVWLYFFTPLVASLPNPVVPWIGFVVALTGSLLLVKIFLRTKVGRFLIG